MRILVTGAAGFIGFHLAKALLTRGDEVVGIDNLNDYYDVTLKQARCQQLAPFDRFNFIKLDIAERDAMQQFFQQHHFDVVVNLAAQAGVRYSLENPASYIDANLVGFANILEGCRHTQVKHLVFASSSSVYGANTKQPFSVHHNVDHPIALYAATKKANELMAHSYANLYDLPCTGLRFFTVYGPWGRPDMALFKFTQQILQDKPIEVYNHGDMGRDFTYIDDIIQGVVNVIDTPATVNPNWNSDNPDPATSFKPYRLYNIGNNNPVSLNEFINILENALGKKAEKLLLPLQPGDVPRTHANIDSLQQDFGFTPKTPLQEGINKFVDWYQSYYR